MPDFTSFQSDVCNPRKEAAPKKCEKQRQVKISFLKLVHKYTDITELTAEIIRTFVERIEVFQSETVPGTRTKKQTIAIIRNFIGAVDIPEEARKTA